MKPIPCTCCHKLVHPSAIHDLRVKSRVCHTCYARRQSEPRRCRIDVSMRNLPGAMFRVVAL